MHGFIYIAVAAWRLRSLGSELGYSAGEGDCAGGVVPYVRTGC